MNELQKAKKRIAQLEADTDEYRALLHDRENALSMNVTKEVKRMMATSGNSGLFHNTFGARSERGEDPGEERMLELRKASEPLREYLLKYGDPHTCVVVTQYGATVKRDEIRVALVKSNQNERTAEFEREIRGLMANE